VCDHDANHPKPQPPRRPDPMPPTNRRPCAIDTSRHCCPHAGCDYRGWLGLGNLRANGHPSGGPWRQLYCRSCHGSFLETHGTLFHGKRLSVELIVHVLACVAEGLGIRATARVFEVDPNTVMQWLGRVPLACGSFLPPENWVKPPHFSTCMRGFCHGLHSFFLPFSTSSPYVVVRHAPLGVAQRPRRRVSDDTGAPRPTAKAQAWALSQITENRKVEAPKPLIFQYPIFGFCLQKATLRQSPLETVHAVLAPLGCQINIAFIERLNLSMRQHVAAVGRRVTTLCKGEDGLRQHLALYQVS
jgi:transposase-like protein